MVLEEIKKAHSHLVMLETRAQKLQTFLKLSSDLGYESSAQSSSRAVDVARAIVHRGDRLRYVVSPAQKSQRDLITDYCANVLRDGFPMKTVDLLQLLSSAGIEVGGANKALALSSYLSKDDRFEPSRKEGWSLKK